MSDNYQLDTQDYLQEDEDMCDVCNNVRNHSELKGYEIDDRGGVALVCNECVERGWAEE